jgi:hypothetical protein
MTHVPRSIGIEREDQQLNAIVSSSTAFSLRQQIVFRCDRDEIQHVTTHLTYS